MKYCCSVCGCKTIRELCNYEICPICFWEENENARENSTADFFSPANGMHLSEGQANYLAYDCADPKAINLERQPRQNEVPGADWRPLDKSIAIANELPRKNIVEPESTYKKIAFKSYDVLLRRIDLNDLDSADALVYFRNGERYSVCLNTPKFISEFATECTQTDEHYELFDFTPVIVNEISEEKLLFTIEQIIADQNIAHAFELLDNETGTGPNGINNS